jgi:hypothetical protein
VRVPFIAPALVLALGQQAIPPPPRPAPAAPVQQPRDLRRPADPTGTASIRGRVVTSDTGTPVRHATLSLSLIPSPVTTQANGTQRAASSPPAFTQTMTVNGATVQANQGQGFARPHSATTDAQGMFEFKDLPAGAYRLSASPGQYSAQYLGISYGAKRPNAPGSNDPGQPIQLSDGQAFTASMALPRGSVIIGHVADENGDPLARVPVYTMFFPVGSLRGLRSGPTVQTDDLGSFRLYGLAPGDYLVVAEARPNTFAPPNAPPETEDERVGWLTTYYPNNADEASAQRVRTRSGIETPGIEIRMVTGRMLHISGMVVDSQGKTDSRFNGQLVVRAPSGNFTNTLGMQTDPTGHFQMRNIPPGDYKLVVRQNVVRSPNQDPRNPPDLGEFAAVPLSLNSDVDDMLVTTRPGTTITGQVVYDGLLPTPVNGQAQTTPRVFAQFADSQNSGGLPAPPPVSVSSDLTFTMKSLMGEFLLRATGTDLHLKAVQLGGEDITDTPREFKQGDSVTIVMTTRGSTIEGNVTDDQGQPVNAASLLIFSDDKSLWRTNSIRTRRGSADLTGHFTLQGLLAGHYYLIALPQERASALNFGSVDPSVFEQFAKEATAVTVGEDEQRQVDLRIATGSGG